MTDSIDTPDARELAKAAVATIRQQARRVWNGSVIMLTSDGEIADAVLAAVSPVIRRQVAEEIAAKIDEEAEFETRRVHPSAFAADAFRDAAAIARSHSTQPETGQDHG